LVVDNFIEQIQRSKKLHDVQYEAAVARPALAEYELPLVTVDTVVFTVTEQKLKVLLIQRKSDPYQGMWAIPGGFIHVGEPLNEAAERRLFEETNVRGVYLDQLRAFATPDRDPRARVITVAFFALVSADKLRIEASANAANIGWFSVSDLPKLAFDHQAIVEYSRDKLRRELVRSSIAFQLLPKEFTLTELQRVYELILDKSLDKRNFRKKMLASGLLLDTGTTKMEGYHRPAMLYSFAKRELALF
jgi:8-oxo-dGTP diphosphatase